MWKEIKYLDSFTIKYKFVEMVHSDKETFPLGYLYFSIDDNIVGIPEELACFKYVYDEIHNFTKEYRYNGRFVNKEFYNSPEAMIFYTLYEQFFSACYDNYSLKEQDNLLYKKPVNKYRTSYENMQDFFHMDYIGEDTFLDNFGLVMINCENKQKLIIKDFRKNILICREYDLGVIDKLLNEFASVIGNAPSDLQSDGS